MSKKAKNLAARLAAVQALYQASHNKQSPNVLVDEYMEHRTGMIIEGEEMVAMNTALFKDVLEGAYNHSKELQDIIFASYSRPDKDIERLLKALLLCASYEISYHRDIDAPIILNDYINIADSFYEGKEKALVNGILDKINKSVRA